MHAKSLACLLEGGTAITRVGSVNMTAAGLYHNKEIEVVLSGREHFDRVLSAAICLLDGSPNLAAPSDVEDLSRQALEYQRALESPEEQRNIPGSAEDQLAYAEAVTWFRGGLRLSRQHQNDEFAVSFPLKKYIDARLIQYGNASDEETGIRIAQDRKSIHIPLLPEARKKALKKLNQSLGTLLSRYALPMAGVSWCRIEWIPTLHRDWREAVGTLDHVALQKELEAHVELLRRTMCREGDSWLAVARLIQHHQPKDWDQIDAERLLGVEIVKQCLHDPEKAQNAIAEAVLTDVYATVKRHLNVEYLKALIQDVGAKPHSFCHEPRDPGSIFEAILDLFSIGLSPMLRSGGAWTERANGIFGKELLRRFSSREDTIALHTKVLKYKRSASEPGASGALPLAALWTLFRRTFRIDAEPIDWNVIVKRDKRRPSQEQPSDVDEDDIE